MHSGKLRFRRFWFFSPHEYVRNLQSTWKMLSRRCQDNILGRALSLLSGSEINRLSQQFPAHLGHFPYKNPCTSSWFLWEKPSRGCFGVTLNCSQALVPKASADPTATELNESEMSAGKSRHSYPKTTLLPKARAAKNNLKQRALLQPCFLQRFCTQKCVASSVLCLSWCPHSAFPAPGRVCSQLGGTGGFVLGLLSREGPWDGIDPFRFSQGNSSLSGN